MASPLSSDIPKPFGSTEKLASQVNRAFVGPVPAFGDLGKAANDLINKDFYHTSQATLDVKLRAPNGTNVTVKGKQNFDGVTSGSVEGKHTLKPHGRHSPPSSSSTSQPTRFIRFAQLLTPLPAPLRTHLWLFITSATTTTEAHQRISLTLADRTGVTITQAYSTNSLLDTKVELNDLVAPGAKIDLQNLWNPSKANSAAQKINLAFKNPNVHSRAFINYAQSNGNIDAVVDVVAGHEGFLVGGEAAYDVQKAAITRYGLALAYQTPSYTASIHGMQNLSIIAASYYQKVNSSVEVGTKVGYDVQAQKASGLELASKYKLDPLSFAKVKVNDRGIAALAYSTKLNAGTTLGLGLSLDTQKLNEAGHKIGTSLTFEG
ncbi:Mitochondrial porin [Recurvomyces mirabilis]|nr:Mitochondrial porin [Recurvomyces mirabilis]